MLPRMIGPESRNPRNRRHDTPTALAQSGDLTQGAIIMVVGMVVVFVASAC